MTGRQPQNLHPTAVIVPPSSLERPCRAQGPGSLRSARLRRRGTCFPGKTAESDGVEGGGRSPRPTQRDKASSEHGKRIKARSLRGSTGTAWPFCSRRLGGQSHRGEGGRAALPHLLHLRLLCLRVLLRLLGQLLQLLRCELSTGRREPGSGTKPPAGPARSTLGAAPGAPSVACQGGAVRVP